MTRVDFTAVALLALALAVPAAARAQGSVAPPVTPSPAAEYQDRYERERLEQERLEQEKRRAEGAPSAAALARRGEGMQVRTIPETDLTVVLHQVKLDDGELLVRLRFYNDGAEPARLTLDPTGAYESFFVEVGGEKLHIQRDDDGDLDAKKPLDVELRPGKMESWWAKFPAPAAGTETLDIEIPPVSRFRNVPLEE